MKFLAIDFETSNYQRDACAVCVTLFDDIVDYKTIYSLIRPPNSKFDFPSQHGITWETVKDQRSFAEVWGEIEHLIGEADYFVAHNASFDRHVLRRSCELAGIPTPEVPFICTRLIASRCWEGISWKEGSSLKDICHKFGIPLVAHYAPSDTWACAQLLKRAIEEGIDVEDYVISDRAQTEELEEDIRQSVGRRLIKLVVATILVVASVLLIGPKLF